MNGGRGSAAKSRVFLALGALVVLVLAVRLVRGGASAVTLLRAGVEGAPGSVPASWRFAAEHAGVLALAAAAALAAVVAIAVGTLRRRPWAGRAAVLALAAAAAAGLAVTAVELSALVRPGGASPEAAEMGYGPAVTYWRIAGGAAALLFAILCAAGIRRLASASTRREFTAENRRVQGDSPAGRDRSL